MTDWNLGNIDVEEGEQILKVYRPRSFFQHVLYPLDKRTALVITTKRVIFRGFLPFLDKTMSYSDISDVIIDGDTLLILKKGVTPWIVAGDPYGDAYELSGSEIAVNGWLPLEEAKQLIDQQRMKLDKKDLI